MGRTISSRPRLHPRRPHPPRKDRQERAARSSRSLRRSRHQPGSERLAPAMVKTLRKLLLFFFALVIVTIARAVAVYRTIPARNTTLTHFDTIIVLCTPPNPDRT